MSALLRPAVPALVLAPMEGVTDAPMRALLSERGGFTYCVSEFLRISQDLPPPRIYLEHTPEFRNGGRTKGGLAVQFQLLGGDAELLARAAAQACALGAAGIDLNFGCPAPTVNRHDGGATLLKYPDRIREIVGAVRAAVPRDKPVSAKLRLGFDDMNSIHVNADRAAEGGADWIAIHGRTKTQGYIPPAYWGPIGEVRRRLGIPVIANGEIWTLDDFRRCRDQTGSIHFMIGRGALADPFLPHAISRELGIAGVPETPRDRFGMAAADWLPLLRQFARYCEEFADHPLYPLKRIKQWTRQANARTPAPWFDALKRLESLDDVWAMLEAETASSCAPDQALDRARDPRVVADTGATIVKTGACAAAPA